MAFVIQIIESVYGFLWGDLVTLPLWGGGTVSLPLLVLLLIPVGIYFTVRTRLLPVRLFPEMVRVTLEKRGDRGSGAISGLQSLIVSTATRVGMGNLVGVVAAISAGGAGAVFWMWITALIGSSTAFIEATLAQLYKEKDPLYGGYRGGPAYYIHHFIEEKRGGKPRRYTLIAVLFALSGLICWFGISQVIGNSVSSAFANAFHIPPPLYDHCTGRTGSRDRSAQKCNRQSAGCAGAPYGGLLFLLYCIYYTEKCGAASGCIPAYFCRSVWISSGGGRRVRCRADEWCEKGTFFQ